ncbi:hypothetical protein Tco_0390524 [Tanacetum coccineum]
MHTARGDGVTSIKRRRRNLSSDNVRKMTTASRHSGKRDTTTNQGLRKVNLNLMVHDDEYGDGESQSNDE